MSDSQSQPRTGAHAVSVITDARTPASAEHDSRVRRYAVTMAFRTACFVSMIWVEGPFRWVLFAGAVLLPYVAVVLANQANQRHQPTEVDRGEPTDLPQLTAEAEGAEVITGTVADGDASGCPEGERVRRVA